MLIENGDHHIQRTSMLLRPFLTNSLFSFHQMFAWELRQWWRGSLWFSPSLVSQMVGDSSPKNPCYGLFFETFSHFGKPKWGSFSYEWLLRINILPKVETIAQAAEQVGMVQLVVQDLCCPGLTFSEFKTKPSQVLFTMLPSVGHIWWRKPFIFCQLRWDFVFRDPFS